MSNIGFSRLLPGLSQSETRPSDEISGTDRRTGTQGMPRSVREQLILRVAGQVFAEGGYDRASMDRIAALAGVSKPMLYAYFGSKEGLYVAYIERTGSELVQRLVGADAGDGRQPSLRSVIGEFLAFVEEHRDGWTVLFRELNTRRPLAEQVSQLRSEIVGEVRRMLEGEGGPERTGLAPPASEGIAEAIVGAGEALANWWLERPGVRREDVTDWYVGLARAAIAAAIRRDDH
jgi:AcrR family transcriptional regulator